MKNGGRVRCFDCEIGSGKATMTLRRTGDDEKCVRVLDPLGPFLGRTGALR
jgi:hypothetical protein